MSEAKHTPGPWSVDPVSMEICSVSAKGYVTICDPCIGKRESTGKLLPVDERQANGRLIAAAPDLLEALVWHEQFRARDGEGGSSFERVAANFHRDTGYLAPGKDCRIHDPEIRQAAWDKWIADGIARTRAAIAKAGVTE